MSTTGWTQGRVDALLAALDTYGMVMSRAAAEDLITERVDAVAQLMRTTKATARHYLTDEAIAGMAESIAFSLAEESPGAELYDAPRTAAVPVNVVGRMVAGLAEACQVRFAERDDLEHSETRVTELVKCLSVLGTIASTEPTRAAAGAEGIAGESADVTMALPARSAAPGRPLPRRGCHHSRGRCHSPGLRRQSRPARSGLPRRRHGPGPIPGAAALVSWLSHWPRVAVAVGFGPAAGVEYARNCRDRAVSQDAGSALSPTGTGMPTAVGPVRMLDECASLPPSGSTRRRSGEARADDDVECRELVRTGGIRGCSDWAGPVDCETRRTGREHQSHRPRRPRTPRSGTGPRARGPDGSGRGHLAHCDR